MPIDISTRSSGGLDYGSPFVGPVDHTVPVVVDVSGLTTDEVDADGYLKPGVPLTSGGVLVGASPAFVYGVTIEPIKVAADNATATLNAADDPTVALAAIGVVNRDIAEDILGRAYTANEIAGFDRAGSKMVLTTT